ncbi:MAG: inorganic phosphate transporter [Bacteroidales bacterium]
MFIIIVIISSGLFLGWLLGSKDTVNLFGSSVSSQRLNFKKAAIIAGILIIIGAIFQGRGTTETIHSLGNISEPAIAFIVVLSAALVVLVFTRFSIKVSTSQSIVGAIVGWSLFTQGSINIGILSKIALAWILAPVFGVIVGALLFILIRWFINKSNVHVIKLDFYLRITLVIAIALAAFNLGANNIGNVIGVFSNYAPSVTINFGIFTLDGLQILFLLGGVSIALGIYSFSRKASIETESATFSLVPETAIVVHLVQAIVLFGFSSLWLFDILGSLGLPQIPLVPVSSTQIVIGAIIGIGIVKGTREIEIKTLAGIGLSWIITPLSAGLLTTAFLFIIQRTFGFPSKLDKVDQVIESTGAEKLLDTSTNINMVLPGVIILIALIILVFIFFIFRQQKLRLKMERDILIQQNQLYQSQKAMNDLEMRAAAVENEALNIKLQAKRKEFMDIAFNINEQHAFLEKISTGLNEIIDINNHDDRTQRLKDLSLIIRQKMSFSKEKKEFYTQIEDIHKDFHAKLKTTYPNLTEMDKRLAGLLRLNLSTKEISSLLNISPKSVEIARYRLKKKLKLEKDNNLLKFISNL